MTALIVLVLFAAGIVLCEAWVSVKGRVADRRDWDASIERLEQLRRLHDKTAEGEQ